MHVESSSPGKRGWKRFTAIALVLLALASALYLAQSNHMVRLALLSPQICYVLLNTYGLDLQLWSAGFQNMISCVEGDCSHDRARILFHAQPGLSAYTQNSAVDSRMLGDGIGYVRVISLHPKDASSDFRTGLEKLSEAGLKGLILDLRNVSGGLFSNAVEVSDMLLDGGVIIMLERLHGGVEVLNAAPGAAVECPIVILVNGNTKSSAEIIAAALSDTGGAVVVGTRTYGKNTASSYHPLLDGSGLMLPFATYFTPDGENISGRGIPPDIHVTEQAAGSGEDPFIQTAVELFAGGDV
jgi:hypothetical protein